jgi:hypothetical protein
VLGVEQDAIPVGVQIQGAVSPGVEIPRAAQGLAGLWPTVLAQVVDDHDGEVVLALQLAEEGQKLRHIPRIVLV